MGHVEPMARRRRQVIEVGDVGGLPSRYNGTVPAKNNPRYAGDILALFIGIQKLRPGLEQKMGTLFRPRFLQRPLFLEEQHIKSYLQTKRNKFPTLQHPVILRRLMIARRGRSLMKPRKLFLSSTLKEILNSSPRSSKTYSAFLKPA